MKAADILSLSDLRTKQVHVPRWGMDVTIRELTLEEGVQLSRLYGRVSKEGDSVTLHAEDVAKVVAWGVVDESGERVFSDDDVPALARKNRDALMLLFREITALAADAEDAEGN